MAKVKLEKQVELPNDFCDGEQTFHLAYYRGNDKVKGQASSYEVAKAKAESWVKQHLEVVYKFRGWVRPALPPAQLVEVKMMDDTVLQAKDELRSYIIAKVKPAAEIWYFELRTDI